MTFDTELSVIVKVTGEGLSTDLFKGTGVAVVLKPGMTDCIGFPFLISTVKSKKLSVPSAFFKGVLFKKID